MASVSLAAARLNVAVDTDVEMGEVPPNNRIPQDLTIVPTPVHGEIRPLSDRATRMDTAASPRLIQIIILSPTPVAVVENSLIPLVPRFSFENSRSG